MDKTARDGELIENDNIVQVVEVLLAQEFLNDVMFRNEVAAYNNLPADLRSTVDQMMNDVREKYGTPEKMPNDELAKLGHELAILPDLQRQGA